MGCEEDDPFLPPDSRCWPLEGNRRHRWDSESRQTTRFGEEDRELGFGHICRDSRSLFLVFYLGLWNRPSHPRQDEKLPLFLPPLKGRQVTQPVRPRGPSGTLPPSLLVELRLPEK